jgi:multimeric flavodoxin WrbA
MKIMCILGSPRKKGNTATVLAWVEKKLRANGHKIDHVNIIDCAVAGCVECNHCQMHPDEDPPCIQTDDANGLFERMMAADVILWASPIFFWGFAAQLKPLIDRLYCLVTGYGTPVHTSRLEGRRFALLLTGGDPYEDNADLVADRFRRLAGYAKCAVAAELYISLCTTPDELGPDVHEQAEKLAQDIMGATA